MPESIFWLTSVTKAERAACVIREDQSICSWSYFRIGHFKAKEAVIKRRSGVIADVLCILNFWILNRQRRG